MGAALKHLEERGYITFASVKESVNSFTISQLKELLMEPGESTTGKKAELVARVSDTISEETLVSAGVQPKYRLTEAGMQELSENAYVSYMHRFPNKITENTPFGIAFNVWGINKLLGFSDKSNWKKIVDEQNRKMNKEIANRNDTFMKDLEKIDPEGYRVLKTQDQQSASVQKQKKDSIRIKIWMHILLFGKWSGKMVDLNLKVQGGTLNYRIYILNPRDTMMLLHL